MYNSSSYVGRRIYINSESGNSVAGIIIEHNKEYMTVTVMGVLRESANNEFVTVLILEDGCVHEYKGKPRRSVTNSLATEIALFKGKEKEDRSAKRFPVNAVGYVESLVFKDITAPLLNPLEVLIVNLSASGILIRAHANSFSAHAVIDLKMDIGDSLTLMRGEIVRMKMIDQQTVEYGCKFISAL